MPKTFRKIKRYATFVLLFSSIFVIIILGLLQEEILFQISKILRDFIWPAIITLMTFFGFVVGGVIKKPPKSFTNFLDNGFVQIAVLQFFTFVILLTIFAYSTQRPGQIELKLASGMTSPKIRVSMNSANDPMKADTVFAPTTLPRIDPGVYTFRIIEEHFFRNDTIVRLKSAEKATLILLDEKDLATLIVNSDPPGANIWIDGSLKGGHITPDTLNNLERKLLRLELRLTDHKSETRNVDLTSSSEVNLGKIILRRLYKVDFLCKYKDIHFTVNNRNYVGTQKEVLLPQGSYTVTIGTDTQISRIKSIEIDQNCTVFIP